MKLLERRRALISANKSLLPKEYQQVEYIKSTRTQYLDTGYIPKKNTRIELDLKFEGRFSSGLTSPKSSGIFGARDDVGGGSVARFTINFGGNSSESQKLYLWIHNAGTAIMSTDVSGAILFKKNKLIFGQGIFEYGDVSIQLTQQKEYNNNRTALLFGNKGTSGDTYFAAYDMYCFGCQFYEYDEIVKNFVPCYRKDTGEIGMYDTIENVFITNKGTGEFLIGGDV